MLRKFRTLARALDHWNATNKLAGATGSGCHYQRRFQATSLTSDEHTTSSMVLAIIKPHAAVLPHVVEDVFGAALGAGLKIWKTKRILLTLEQVEELYTEHRGKFFFQRATEMMSSGEVIAILLFGKDAVKRWRSLMGPTKVSRTKLTHPETLRGRFGLTDTRNAVHGSDSLQSTQRECGLLFPDFEMSERGWDKLENTFQQIQAEDEHSKVLKEMCGNLIVLENAKDEQGTAELHKHVLKNGLDKLKEVDGRRARRNVADPKQDIQE